MPKSASALATWDFRYNADGHSVDQIRKYLEGIAKHYVFQLEQGDSGYRHYQGRMSLIKKRRKAEKHLLLKGFKDNPPNYVEPTCNPEHVSNSFDYVLKEDTRLEGPYKDTDHIPVLTKQMEIFMKYPLRPYQASLREISLTFDMRRIDLVYDPIGNIGKSLLSEYLYYKGLAEEVPPMRLMDDIFQWVCSRPTRPCYIVDMPRGMKKDKLGDFYAGIEVIKNGVAYDKRYSGKLKRFDRPRVIVFTNTLPILSLMSADRWNLWEVNENYELVAYVKKPLDNMELN